MNSSAKTVKISNSISVGNNSSLLLIAGPCQIESRDHCMQIAEFLKKLSQDLSINLVFKSSFDKANRTSISGARGIGIDKGLNILDEIKKSFALPALTDVHSVDQIKSVAEVVDVIQIPAFLCRQTDLLLAAGETRKVINVKKGQYLSPNDMQHVAKKISSTGNENILLCERGTCFGYRDLVVDMRGLVIMKDTGYPVIFDATHSVQVMGGSGAGSSGGERRFVEPLLRAAVATGVDGVFIECHNDPDSAPSDGASMVPLSEMPKLINIIKGIREATFHIK
jgi:2-dehydro-3-deoxyphosphooctonate aldolase (KDO 8-P synthase)